MGKDWEFGVSIGELLCIGRINNKALLYNTGNYIQFSVITSTGKECKKEYIYIYTHNVNIYIYITESLCHRAETNTIVKINYISIIFLKCMPWKYKKHY